jgi:hypothetical protein
MGDTGDMSMSIIDLQRRVEGERADELLAHLAAELPGDQPVAWNESGHARIELGREREDAREYLEARLSQLADDWAEHIAVL